MLWVALHLPALSLESWRATLGPAEVAEDAEEAEVAPVRRRPLALLQPAPQAHCIAMPDATALARGVQPGMKRATAQALAPDLLLGQADARRDAEALRAVAHVALAFSPSVCWATPAGWRPAVHDDPALPQPAGCPALVGVRLEVQSCLRYHGGLPALLERLRAQLAPLGHRVRLATAPTALGAALLAAWREDLALGPHSTRIEALRPLIDALPLALLLRGSEGTPAQASAQAEALQAMGLRRVGDLAGLPREGLARRLGPTLLHDIDRARGQAPEAHTWLTLPLQFSSRLELFSRADTSAQVLAGAGSLLARLVAWVQARQVRVQRFALVMHHEPRRRSQGEGAPERTVLEIAPALPSADAAHLASLLAERLGRLPLPAPTLELSLLCAHTVAGGAPDGELFASPGSRREGLARLVERLQARLGREQVLRPVPLADRRPECSTGWRPADAARLPADAQPLPPGTAQAVQIPGMAGTARLARTELGAQPLWLLPEPQPLPLRDGLPLHQGRPLLFLAGPERLETGWWDGAPALRDYFIARDAAGALVWVYCSQPAAVPSASSSPRPSRAAPLAWFLQGLFA